MQDPTLVVEKTPEQLAKEKADIEAKAGEWFQLTEELAEKKAREMELRNELVRYYFPNGLKEGTNKAELPEGWTIKATGVVNRKIDVVVQMAVQKELAENFHFDSGEYVKYKPELSLSDYRTLEAAARASDDPESRAKKLLATFDQMLIVTAGSPQVEMVAPKKKKG